MMSDKMIYEGYGPYSLEKGRTKLSAGLSFIRNVYIDTHFTEGAGSVPLAIAVSQHPDYIGIGLGEETGIIIRDGNLMEVFGIGVGEIIDGSEIKNSNIHDVAHGAPIAVEHLVMHLLVEGQQYALKEKVIRFCRKHLVVGCQLLVVRRTLPAALEPEPSRQNNATIKQITPTTDNRQPNYFFPGNFMR